MKYTGTPEFFIRKKKEEDVANCPDDCNDKQKDICNQTGYYPEHCPPNRITNEELIKRIQANLYGQLIEE